MNQSIKDPIREKLCPTCKVKYDKPEAFSFCEECKKLLEPKETSRHKKQKSF